ncbi:Eco57I restriction-modification methylase domain-containing protein [Lactococcus laudensis]|uniref:Eco57I restriction-modification methylase domain-containing protein n=1 Tax=Pseudolactococcus laudensis TaxID=1494461 RepID=A0A7V8N2Z3_9LACT|nr:MULTISPECIES: Eco57I restriction-modification methylase domain-containing protein [Lactococcus]MBA0017543.1 Eco57I restriction-modification methylase domain-containing protein [Lactococcus laudensis]MBW9282349.1 restriction endonuclease [Lactococcus laudensis]MDG4962593.1 Eco57I restriction-modification methylase domain-containing protein [Lactococcus raffinolactis]
MSKNFEFLMVEADTAVLFETANLAEKNYTHKDYEGTLTKVRKVAEKAVSLILEKEAIILPSRTNFNNKLNEANLRISEQYIIQAFYDIKKLGNLAAHEVNTAEATQENALKALNHIFVILVWFVKKYTSTDIQMAYMDFLEPEAERLYQAAERKLIYIQTVNNESGMFQAYEGTQKIGEATAPDDDFEVDWSPNSEFLRTVGARRVNQYMKTAGLKFVLEWVELAWKKSTKTWFHDHDVHEVLKRSGVKKPELLDGSEWFKTDLDTAKEAIKAVKEGRSALQTIAETAPTYEIKLRPEQENAITKTKDVFKKKNNMLWNAKMRFGKTLTSLQLIKDEKYQKVLIMTHRPVVSDSWFEDFGKMKMADEGYDFGSKDKGENLENLKRGNSPFIYFVSIQKLRYGGGETNLAEFSDIDWNLIIIDEAHEGTQTELADVVLNAVKKEKTKVLELSGTPFNLLDQYDEDQIYTWDYTMEQTAKLKWSLENPDQPNPYESLPKVSMYTFEMRNKEKYADESKAFNFREFFHVDDNGELVHKEDVNAFLDNITNQENATNYPFSTEQYRNELRHTLWLMPGVKEANAFEKLLNEHRVFGQEYNIVNVVKDDKSDNTEVATEGDLEKVRNAITNDPSQTKTITLTVRKLTTGVNIPEWTAVLFLSNTNSAMNYLQAAFRAQTPFSDEKLGMKKNCYIFDFAPDRALSVMAESAQVNSGVGKKNTQEQKDMLTRLLNFMPILGNSEMGMTSFNVDKMLTQLKKVCAEKAVRSGFEDDSLYNDRLLTLTEGDTKVFQDLNAIVGKTQGQKKVKITISENGLSDEEYDKGEKAKKKPARQRTPEEKEAIDKINEAKKQRKTMISILRGVSIRIPMMIYGMKLDLAKDISIQDFVKEVDDESWKEFMPKGFTKGMFKQIVQYYDAEVFVEAGRIIRQRAKSYDQLDFIERAEKIAELFSTFKNPDKETVLTPWRVVNLQLTKTIGGLNFFDDEFVSTTDGAVSNLHWVERNDTDKIYTDESKFLEINTKTGLYPLHVAMSLYYQAVNKNEDIHFEADEVYKKILKENIFAIAKTEMAKTITERTLAGYKSFETNVQYIDGFVEAIKESPAKGKSKVEETFKNVKFDVVIGNPPYQEESIGDSTQAPPIYHKFMDTAYEVADKAVLITPGRFLFNAGATGKAWNEKMLNDEHLKVIFYEQDSSRIFPNTDIKGGVAVTYRSVSDNFGAIGTFTSFEELNSILHKVSSVMSESFSTIFYPQTKVNQQVDDRFPTERRMRPNWFEKFPEIFLNEPDNQHTIKIVGLEKGNKRTERFVSKEIIADSNIEKFKVFVTEANGSGNLGEILSSPIIGEPQIGCTQTFLQVGSFDKKSEAENCLNYIKTKFSRAMLGLLKITQHNPPTVWAKVPLQDFTPNSDIDWTKSIPEIDQQLYTKYGLSQDEIDFIEEKVKVME